MRRMKELPAQQRDGLLSTLKARFEAHMNRHSGIDWTTVRARLASSGSKLWSLHEMERTGGEPDVVVLEKTSGHYTFIDCSAQSPKGAGVCATTAPRSRPGKSLNRTTALRIWQRDGTPSS